MPACVICTDIINIKFNIDWRSCIQCLIYVCIKCFKYGNKNGIFSDAVYGYFYCSMNCISQKHSANKGLFTQFIRATEKNEYVFFGKLYSESQERAYTKCISLQIKRLLNDVILADIGNVICEFL